MAKLSLGLQLGYWGQLAPGNAHVELAQEAERAWVRFRLDGGILGE